jgi:hypothetical protein
MATISLCIIARDEERFLEGCLASVQGVVSQIVLVDTGSTDRTRDIARAAGAVVVDHPWADDFAAARNAALPHATGDWILVLDADERLAPGAGAAIRAALKNPSFVLGLLPLSDASRLDATAAEVLDGRARRGEAFLLPRLVRRLPDLAWRGRLHENIGDWISRNGRRATQIPADIVHYGAVPELREARGKGGRNLRILELQCAEDPEAVFAWAYLAAERERAGDSVGAEAAEESGWEMLGRAVARGERPSAIPLAGRRGQRQLVRGDLEGVLATVAEARRWGTDHPNLCWLAGSALLRLGRDCVDELERAVAWTAPCSDEIYEGVRGWRCRQLLAVALLDARPADSLRHAEAAFAEKPTSKARLLCVDALLALGHADRALVMLEPVLAEDLPDAWALAAVAVRRLGDIGTAQVFASKVRAPIEPRRVGIFSLLQAELAFRAGMASNGAGPWGTIGRLVDGRPVARAASVDDATLRDAVGLLVARGDSLGIEALLTPRAEGLVPGLRERVLDALRDAGLDWVDDREDFVFIGGAGRSGTTLFRAMIAAHPRLWCGPERKLIPIFADANAKWLRSLGPELREAGLGEAEMDGAARAWIASFMNAGVPRDRRIAEKTPHNLVHGAWLGRLFPRARFIHVLRDGHAVAESLVRQRWCDPATGELVPYCQNLTNAASYWASVVTESRRQGAQLPRRYLEVRYETLIARPRETMAEVLAFLGEPWDDAVLAHETAGVPLSTRESSTAAVGQARSDATVDAWRHRLSPADIQAIEKVAGPALRAAGY